MTEKKEGCVRGGMTALSTKVLKRNLMNNALGMVFDRIHAVDRKT